MLVLQLIPPCPHSRDPSFTVLVTTLGPWNFFMKPNSRRWPAHPHYSHSFPPQLVWLWNSLFSKDVNQPQTTQFSDLLTAANLANPISYIPAQACAPDTLYIIASFRNCNPPECPMTPTITPGNTSSSGQQLSFSLHNLGFIVHHFLLFPLIATPTTSCHHHVLQDKEGILLILLSSILGFTPCPLSALLNCFTLVPS